MFIRSLFLFSIIILYASPSWSLQARIIGGTTTTVAEHPWIAGLIVRGAPAFNGQYCGGSLIAPNVVLTAAHCVTGTLPEQIDVLLGVSDLNNEAAGERIAVTAIESYSDYDSDNLTGDIALLILASNSSQTPIGLPTFAQRNTFTAGSDAEVTGWGNRSTTDNDFPSELHTVTLEVSDETQCNQQWVNSLDLDQQFCAQSPDSVERDSCNGDSGGPLVSRLTGSPLLIGIVSFGETCGDPDRAGVYTRVSHYEDFINTVMGRGYSLTQSANFGIALQDRAKTFSLTLSNFSSSAVLVASNPQLQASNVVISADNCNNQVIDPQGSCQITLSWTATSAQTLSGSFSLDIDDGSNSNTLTTTLSGTSLAPTALADALDISGVQVYTGGGATFTLDSVDQVQGGQSVHISNIDTNQPGIIAIETTAAGTVNYSHKDSGAYLDVYLDEQYLAEVAVQTDWTIESVDVEAGILIWYFSVGEGTSYESRLDNIVLNGTAVPDTDTSSDSDADTDSGSSTSASSSGSGGGGGGGALDSYSLAMLLAFGLLAVTRRHRQQENKHAA